MLILPAPLAKTLKVYKSSKKTKPYQIKIIFNCDSHFEFISFYCTVVEECTLNSEEATKPLAPLLGFPIQLSYFKTVLQKNTRNFTPIGRTEKHPTNGHSCSSEVQQTEYVIVKGQ